MTDPQTPTVVLTAEARQFLKRTGVVVIAIEVAVLFAIWLFQIWLGR